MVTKGEEIHYQVSNTLVNQTRHQATVEYWHINLQGYACISEGLNSISCGSLLSIIFKDLQNFIDRNRVAKILLQREFPINGLGSAHADHNIGILPV